MKKWYVMFFAGVMTLMLAACGESAEEVYTEAMDATEDMESTEATMDLTQEMDMGAEGSMTVEATFDADMTVDPMTMHMEGNTSLGGDEAAPGMGMDVDLEIYVVDGEMYMHNGMMDQWIKTDSDEMDEIADLAGQEPDPIEQLEMFEDYTDDLSFEEEDGTYVFTLEADGEEFEELLEEILEENMSTDMFDGMGAAEQEMLDSADIESIDMEMELDKDSYQLSTYDIDMDIAMEIEGQEVSISQNLESEYSNYNGVDPVEVPDDVKDQAQEAGGMGF